jgi:hypothetical protein
VLAVPLGFAAVLALLGIANDPEHVANPFGEQPLLCFLLGGEWESEARSRWKCVYMTDETTVAPGTHFPLLIGVWWLALSIIIGCAGYGALTMDCMRACQASSGVS